MLSKVYEKVLSTSCAVVGSSQLVVHMQMTTFTCIGADLLYSSSLRQGDTECEHEES